MSTLALGSALNPGAPPPDTRAGKYLTFFLGDEEFGLRVTQVKEIIGIQQITGVPHVRPEMKGVINLRGRVIPVMDLRCKLGLPPVEYGHRTCLIVIQMDKNMSGHLGLIVDGVSEVLALSPADIEDAPSFGTGANPSCLLGLAKVRGSVKILLDLNEVLAAGDLEGFPAAVRAL